VTGPPDVWRFQRRHWLLVGVACVVGWVGGVPPTGVLAGGAAIGLLTLLYATAFLAALRRGSLRLALVILFAKVSALLGLGWLVLTSRTWRPDPVAFTIGVSCLPVAAVWEAVRARKDHVG
jgi:glucose-6-phosphate-specific signal transduction histidine kinase